MARTVYFSSFENSEKTKYVYILFIAAACSIATMNVIQSIQWSLTSSTVGINRTTGTSGGSHISSSTPKSYAVVHMGIHKAGSTSIQGTSKSYASELQEDGYEMPWVVFETKGTKIPPPATTGGIWGRQNQVNFATCFLPKSTLVRKHKPCVPELVASGLEIAKRNNNVLITAEAFANLDSNQLRDLSRYLSNWDEVTVVIYYRRFYDWIASFFNDCTKRRTLRQKARWDYTVVDFISFWTTRINNENNKTKGKLPASLAGSDIPHLYIIGLLERVKKHFDNVVVINMHNTSDNSQAFYCDAMPNAHHTCKAITDAKQSMNSKSTPRLNSRVDLIYSDLVYGAKERGLLAIQNDEQLKRFTKEVQEYQEQTLNRTKDDFQMQCLLPNVQKMLLLKSIEYEQMLFPTTANHSDLELHFKKAVTTSSMCTIDVDATLKETVWQTFFKHLGEQAK